MEPQPLPFHKQLKLERERLGLSQAELAERIKSNVKTITRWENGESLPQPLHRRTFGEVFGKSLEELGLAGLPAQSEQANGTGDLQQQYKEEWGDAPRRNRFYGRAKEQTELRAWMVDQRCHIIALFGIGGIGKSSLAVQMAMQVKDSFSAVFWGSLRKAPPLVLFLQQCLQFLSLESQPLPTRIDELLNLLLRHLQMHRCLLVLDNFEALLQPSQSVGLYWEGYESYGRLLQLFGETDHQSCLLLTSREKPREIIRLEGKNSPVRSLTLAGVGLHEGQELLQEKGLSGTPQDWAQLIHLYSGNPLALKIVAEPIQEVFNGDIASFLEGKETVLGDIDDLIAQQFQRLTPPEEQVLYHLAIEREPISWQDLLEKMQHTYSKSIILLKALDSLRRRSLVEVSERESEGKLYPSFTLQPMIREYVTKYFEEQTRQEAEIPTQTQPLNSGTGEQRKAISVASTQIVEASETFSLKEARLDRGWTQAQLAAMVGVSERAYRAWENGDAYPSDLPLRRLAKVFGKKPEELGLEKKPVQSKTSLTYATLSVALQELVERNIQWAEAGLRTDEEKVQMVGVIRQILLEIEAGRVEKVAERFGQAMLGQDAQS